MLEARNDFRCLYFFIVKIAQNVFFLQNKKICLFAHVYFSYIYRKNSKNPMKGKYIGEFEEIVMLSVGILYDEAYGLVIKELIEERLGRRVGLGALHSTLVRLEDKGYLDSRYGESTKRRGGKRKRLFRVTMQGQKALKEMMATRQSLWNSIPPLAFEI
jgi:PadR family transcriptional regulator PadR